MPVGRGVFHRKRRVENCLNIDMSMIAKKYDLEREAELTVTWRSLGSSIGIHIRPPWRIRLSYTITRGWPEKKVNIDYYIFLDTTPCYYGGQRWWFLCPNCNRRCRILYYPAQADYFACRICYNLTYRSQQVGRTIASTFDAFGKVPFLIAELRRIRSPRKRAILLRKLCHQCKNLSAFTALSERRERRHRRKK
jgi:hypothetical protein